MARLSLPRAPEGPHASHVLSCSRHTDPSCPVRLAPHWPAAAAWFVCQTLQSILQKTPCPLVHKAPADPDGLGNMGNRPLSAISKIIRPRLARPARMVVERC